MTATIVIMAIVAALAAVVALWQQRSHRPAPTKVAGDPPDRLDRADFRAPAAPVLIAVFSSATCSSCAAVWSHIAGFESAAVVTENVEVDERPDLHKRYRIDSVPTTVVVDQAGHSQAAFVGPLGPSEREQLAAIVAAHG